MNNPASAIQVKVTLQEIDPPIWRRLLMPADASLEDLHWIIQQAMGWWNSHLHEFNLPDRRIGRPDWEDDAWYDDTVPPLEDARYVKLIELSAGPGFTFEYLYDFGDSWHHEIVIEGVRELDAPLEVPECLDGARACPPEDCGGPDGYEEMLASWRDPSDPEHDEWLEWLPDGYDPEAFNLVEINWILRQRFPHQPDLDDAESKIEEMASAAGLDSGHLQVLIQQELRRKEVTSFEEAEAVVAELLKEYEDRQRHYLGGLSPRQADRLINNIWTDPESAIKLNDSLSLDELKGSRLLVNTRVVLWLMKELGPVKATSAGNLNRRFVGEAIRRMVLEPVYIAMVRTVSKAINEGDVWPLQEIRQLLLLFRLIRRYKGSFRITKKGEQLLEEDRAGELFAYLFRNFFQRLDLSSTDWLPPVPFFQQTIAYPLWKFSQMAVTWRHPEELVEELILPTIRGDLLSQAGRELPVVLQVRMLEPLERFGLAEKREISSEDKYSRDWEFRPAPLYSRFLRFDL